MGGRVIPAHPDALASDAQGWPILAGFRVRCTRPTGRVFRGVVRRLERGLLWIMDERTGFERPAAPETCVVLKKKESGR